MMNNFRIYRAIDFFLSIELTSTFIREKSYSPGALFHSKSASNNVFTTLSSLRIKNTLILLIAILGKSGVFV